MKEIDHSIHPSKKDKKWISNGIKIHWDCFLQDAGGVMYNAQERYDQVRKYMIGAQDVSKYRSLVIPKELAEDDKTWERVNFEVFPLIPKIRRIVLDLVKKLRYSINVEVIDALAVDDQDKYYADIASKIMLRKKLEENGLSPDQYVPMGDGDPRDFKELEIHMKYTYKHQAAIEVESVLDQIMTSNRYDEIRDQVVASIFDHNLACVREYRDYDDELKPEFIPLSRVICSPVENGLFDDIEFAGEVLEMSFSDIENHMNSEDSEEELKSLKESYNSYLTRSKHQTSRTKPTVLRLEFISENKKTFETRTTSNGKKIFGEKTKGSKNKTFREACYDVVYSGYWVVDTDFFFGCQLDTDMKRHPKDLKTTKTSYHFISPELYNGRTVSIGEQLIPFADSACIAWYKLQNAVLRAKPKGILWEMTSLSDLQVDGSELGTMENISMFNLTGNLAYRRVDEEGEVVSWKPIEELEGGIGSQGAELISLIDTYVQYALDATGLNQVTDGSTPNPKMLKSVAQLAQLGTNNSINFIHESEKMLTDRVATELMIRVLDQARDGSIEVYKKSLGENTVRFFKLTKENSWRDMGIFFEEEPSQEDKERLSRRIEVALATPEGGAAQITVADANFIEGIKNPKMAMEYLAYVVEKNEQKRNQEIALREQRNMEAQAQAARVAGEEERKTKMEDHQMKLEQINAEYQWKYKIATIEQQGFIQGEVIKGNARENEARRDQQTKLSLAENKEPQKKN